MGRRFRKGGGIGRHGPVTECTEDVIASICRDIMLGDYLETASAKNGIRKETLHKWLRQGAEAPDSIWGQLLDSVRQAQAISESNDVQAITAAGEAGDWHANAWKLERKFRSRWGKVEQVEQVGGGAPIVQILLPSNGRELSPSSITVNTQDAVKSLTAGSDKVIDLDALPPADKD